MEPQADIALRSTRDRVVDLLGVADSYPLTDLPLARETTKVPFGGIARIPIGMAQRGVTYALCSPDGRPLGAGHQGEGQDTTLVLDSPPVQANITYRIRASKALPAASSLAPQAPRWLNQAAPVAVGIDTGLVIELRDLPLLDRSLGSPAPADPRLVPWGSRVDVWILRSQEAVVYSLVLGGVERRDLSCTGDLHDVFVTSAALTEDLVIQVRATKTFSAGENRPAETTLLDARLHVKVMARPDLALAVGPGPVVDHAAAAVIRIAASQPSASYRVHVAAIADAEFVRGEAAPATVVSVPVEGKPNVQVRVPAAQPFGQPPPGFTPLGVAAVPGSGDELQVATGPLQVDSIFIVQAIKDHRNDSAPPDAPTIASAVVLAGAAVVLVRPDPQPALLLRMPVAGNGTGTPLQVGGGQRGVYYHFRPAPDGPEFALPAYVHQRDRLDPAQNKGVGQLAVEVDLAIAADPPPGTATAAPATTPPLAPLLDAPALPVGGELAVRAVKAQTGVESALAQRALLAPMAAARALETAVELGARPRFVVSTSDAADSYRLWLAGEAVGPAQTGTGGELEFTGAALQADARFELRATRVMPAGLAVDRVLALTVLLRPDATLALSVRADRLSSGAGTEVVVEASQTDVLYQLLAGTQAVGAPLAGSGRTLALATGPLRADTTFSVAATRADDATVSVLLAARVAVTVVPA